jgi:hypothetical protein
LRQALNVVGSEHLAGVIDSLGELIDHYAQTIGALPPQMCTRNSSWSGPMRPESSIILDAHRLGRTSYSQPAGCPTYLLWLRATWENTRLLESGVPTRGQEVVQRGTVVYAKPASQEMRAAAMAGDENGMARARRQASKAIAELPADTATSGALSIALAEDPPYTATSLLFLGRNREAVTATTRVIETVYQPEARQRGEHPSGYARSLLILGLAHAALGQLDESLAAGRIALSGSRPVWPTMVLADKLDEVLGQQFAEARQTAEYHDRYLQAINAPAAHQLQLPRAAKDRG